MSAELTAEQIALLNEEEKRDYEVWLASTAGEWAFWKDEGDTGDKRVCLSDGQKCVCCVALMGNVDSEGLWTPETVSRWDGDAAHIARAHNRMPALLAEIARLRAIEQEGLEYGQRRGSWLRQSE